MPAHIAPPNWNAYCGQKPDENLQAYDLCSLPDDITELNNSEKWCQTCVKELLEETRKEFVPWAGSTKIS